MCRVVYTSCDDYSGISLIWIFNGRGRKWARELDSEDEDENVPDNDDVIVASLGINKLVKSFDKQAKVHNLKNVNIQKIEVAELSTFVLDKMDNSIHGALQQADFLDIMTKFSLFLAYTFQTKVKTFLVNIKTILF